MLLIAFRFSKLNKSCTVLLQGRRDGEHLDDDAMVSTRPVIPHSKCTHLVIPLRQLAADLAADLAAKPGCRSGCARYARSMETPKERVAAQVAAGIPSGACGVRIQFSSGDCAI